MTQPWMISMFEEAARLVQWLEGDAPTHAAIEAMIDGFSTCLGGQGRALSCGNGGSMSDAMHFAEELSGRYRDDRPALGGVALSDSGHLTCVANDYGFDEVFARGVQALGRPGDVLLAISTSGNSANVLRAAEEAQGRQMKVYGLLGKGGGALRERCDHAVVVPSQDTGRIQEVHIKVIHALIEGVERRLFPDNYA